MFKISNQRLAPKFLGAFFSLVMFSFCAVQVSAQFGPTPTFAPPISYPTLYNEQWVQKLITADLNNDGKPDLVHNSGIYLNDGSGGFGAPTPFANIYEVGDFNNDGHLDLLTKNSFGLGFLFLEILYGDGTGDFTEPPDGSRRDLGACMSNGLPYEVLAADFNNDNQLDLLVEGVTASGLFSGNGSSYFTPLLCGPVEEGIRYGIPVADMNLDGNLDVISNGFILLGDGTGNFTEIQPRLFNNDPYAWDCGDGPRRCAIVADFNADGRPDIALGNGATIEAQVYLADGAGWFEPYVSYPVGALDEAFFDIQTADMNGDGKLDLVTLQKNKINILLGKGDGTFGSLTSFSSFNLNLDEFGGRIALADFNGDGKTDIAEIGRTTDEDVPSGYKFFVFINTTYQTPVGQNSTVTLPQADFTFDEVTAGGTTSVSSIDPATAGDVPGGFALMDLAFEVSTTATFAGSVTTCFNVPNVNDMTEFSNLRVLHNENGTLVDRTSSWDYPNRKICATTTSFSPFYLATVGKKMQSLFDRSRAFKSGSTVPVKVKILNENSQNISSATLPLTTRALRRIGSNTTSDITDAGNSNPDFTFRYDSNLQGYIYNLKTTGLAAGKYVLSFYAGSDTTFFYTVQFEVR